MSNLKTVKKTIHIPGELLPLIEKRIKSLRYPSMSAYFVGLALFDCYCKKEHWLTAELMREPDWVRDQAIAEIVKEFDNPESKAGGWFEARMRELVKQFATEGQN